MAVVVLLDVGAGDDVAVAEADGGAGGEAPPALRRVEREVVALDPELAREGDAARARGVGGRRHVVRPVRRVDPLRLLGQVLDDQLQRGGHGEDAGGDGVEVVADGVLVAGDLDAAVHVRHADLVVERAERLGADAAAALGRERRHARVVPAADDAFLDEPAELALAHHRVVEVEPGELVLVRPRLLDPDRVEVPVVERAVDVELQRADRVADAFDRVLLPVGPVVEREDLPVGAAAVVVGVAADPVHQRVAQLHVRVRHRPMLGVDLGAEDVAAVRVLAAPHLVEQAEVLLDGPAAVGRGRAGFGDGPAALADGVLGLAVDVGEPLLHEVDGPIVELLEVVGGEADGVGVEAEPADVALDRFHELEVLGLGVRVVEAEVAAPAEPLGEAEVDADGLAVSEVGVAVGLGRPPRDDLVVAAGIDVARDDLLEEVGGFGGRLHGAVSVGEGVMVPRRGEPRAAAVWKNGGIRAREWEERGHRRSPYPSFLSLHSHLVIKSSAPRSRGGGAARSPRRGGARCGRPRGGPDGGACSPVRGRARR